MSYNPSNIRSALKTLLTAVTGIANVYDKNVSNIEGYPAIIFDQTNDSGEMLDDSNNIHEVTFTAEIYVETITEGQASAITLLDTAVNNVLTALEKKSNASLSGNVDWVIPTSGRSQQIETTQGVVYMKEIIIRCKVAVSIL
jgi:hypothetical protein